MALKIIEQTEEITHAALSGRLDSDSVRGLEKQFQALVVSRQKPVVLDLYGVTFLSSMAMRMLLTAAKELGKSGAKVVLLNPHRLAELGLKGAGLDGLMPIEHDLDRALALIRKS